MGYINPEEASLPRTSLNPQAEFSITGRCAGKPTTFQDESHSESDPIVSWSWDFGDLFQGQPAVASVQHPRHTYSREGRYLISLIVISQTGLTDTVEKWIDIFPRTLPPTLADQEVCYGDVVNLQVATKVGVETRWFEQETDSLPFFLGDSLQTPALPYSTTFYVQTTSHPSCQSRKVPVAIKVFSPETISILPDRNQFAWQAREITFAIKSNISISAWQWDFGDGDTSHQAKPVHQFPRPGTYEVNVVVTDQQGCDVNIQKELVIKSNDKINFASAFSPNGDGINDFFLVKHQGVQSLNIAIYNHHGQLVYSSQDPAFRWDGRGLNGIPVSEGVYVFELEVLFQSGRTQRENDTVTLIR
ncbi:MAG: PKD domain-containing protein [Bacteroidota bacterium]